MKKKSTLQSGFLKLRVSLSLLLFSAGVFLALLGSGLFAVAEEQQAPKNASIQSGQSYHNDVSPALRDLAMLWPAQGSKDLEAREANLHPRLPLPLHMDVPDRVVEHNSVLKTLLPGIISPALNPNGIPAYSGVGDTSTPPDTNGVVGLTQYLQVVHGGYQVFSKATGASILGLTAVQAIWSGFGGVCQSSGNGDPVALYDHLANRWLISQFANAASTTDQCIAISTTSDATGTYNRYAFHLGSNFFDYPHLGVWPDGYYMSTNVFDAGRTLSFGPQAFAFDRAQMLAGLPATFVTPGITGGGSEPSFLPGDLDGSIIPPVGTANPFVSFPGAGVYNVRLFHADFATPSNTTFDLIGSPTAAGFAQVCPSTPACVPQLDATIKLDARGDRLMSRLAYRKFADGHEAIVGNYTVSAGGVAGVRWFELRAVTTAPVVFQESTYQPDTTWRWMGSAAMDQNGDLAIGFSASNATSYPEIRYAGRLVTDPKNTLGQGEATLFSGTRGQTGNSNRWGDYNRLTVDPVDDCTFWYAQEYYSMTGSSNGSARIGSFKFPTCPAAPIASPVVTPEPTLTVHSPAVPDATATATATATGAAGPFASDPFDDTTSVNITSRPLATGQTWAAATSWSGMFLTTGTGNAYSNASNKMDVITTDAPSADYTVSANVTYITFNSWDIGVVGRGNAAGSNCYLATVLVTNNGATQTLSLIQIAGGNFTSLGSYTLTGSDLLTPGSVGLIELVMNGSSISVRWKGTQRIAVTNTLFTAAGRAGIWAGLATSSTGPQFKDFNATLAGGASPTPTSSLTPTPTPSPTPTATVCGTTSTVSNTTPITIPDTGNAIPYPSSVTVAGAGTILATPGSVQVTINNFSHTFPSDVGILLVGPTGAALLLQDGAGGGNAIVNVTYTLSDTGATQLPDTGVLGPGTYKPTSYFLGTNFPPPGPGTVYGNPGPAGGGTATFSSIFGGTNANGTWSLYVVDSVSGKAGAIAGGWSLSITTNIGCPTPTPTLTPTPTATVCGMINTVSNTTPITIPDVGNGIPYPSTVTVTGAGRIFAAPGSVQVTINNFSHTFPDDVGIVLVGPTGAALLLQDGGGDGTPIVNVTYTFSDTGATQLPDNGTWGPGTYRPAAYYSGSNFPPPGPGTTYGNPGPVGGGTATFASVFGGTNANGTWSLYVEDFVSGKAGSIAGGWTLTVTTDLGCPTPTPTPTPTVCGMGGTFSNAAPITIPDSGNGVPYPSTVTVAGIGTIPATAGSVQVSINSFSHTFPGDVGIVLVGPTGAAFLLQDGAGNEAMTNITYTFSDTGATILPKTGSWGPGTYKPTSYYSGDIFPAPGPGADYANPGPAGAGTATFASVFAGTNANGVWSLYVEDFVAGESGSIAGGWSLTFTIPPCGTPTPTPSASPTPAQVSISGTILYCSNPVPGPVPNVTLTLTGTASGSTLSDSSGNYTFSSLPSGGSYTVTPTKAARIPGSDNINTVDVIAVQKQFLTGTFLTGCRLTAADVNGDSVVNTQDVIAVQRFFNGFTTAIANVGKYQFIPVNRTYTGIVTNQTAQDYDTLVFGDVASPFVEPASTPPPTPTPTGTPTATATATATATPPLLTPTPTPTPTVTPTPTPTATPTATEPPPTVSISGTLLYCSNPVPGPVPNVTLTLTGTVSGSTLSDASGNYSFTGLPSGGNYTVTPSKAARPPGSANINTVDVIGVQKQFLTGTFLTGCRLMAADVNGDTVVTTQDVIAVQRFFSGFTNAIANVGKYQFTPASRTYAGITTNQTGQNYDTLVFGDVAAGFVELADSPSQTEGSNGASAVEVAPTVAAIALPEIATDQANFIASVKTSAIDANNKLVGFQGDLTFDERVVTFQSEPVQKAGLTGGNWNVSGNVLPGTGPIRTLRISAYSTDFTPLSGSGTLFELRMTRVNNAARNAELVWAAPPDNFIFIDADLNTQKPGNAAPGSVTPSRKRR